MSETVIDNPPYEPPPGGADVAPPVVYEDPPDPEVVAYVESTQLPPDPREEPAVPPPVVEPPVNVDVPYVAGDGTVGETLTCTMGNWENEPTSYEYQWMANGITVSTAGDSYVIAEADAGKDVTCMVTASNAAGSVQVISNAVSVAPPAEDARSSNNHRRRH